MRVIRLLMMTALAAATATCGDDTGTNDPGDIIVGPGRFYSPATLTLPSGGRNVTWAWRGETHTVTFEDAAPGSGNRSSGTFSRDFTGATPGPYRFRCLVPGHSSSFTVGMVGSVVVP